MNDFWIRNNTAECSHCYKQGTGQSNEVIVMLCCQYHDRPVCKDCWFNRGVRDEHFPTGEAAWKAVLSESESE